MNRSIFFILLFGTTLALTACGADVQTSSLEVKAPEAATLQEDSVCADLYRRINAEHARAMQTAEWQALADDAAWRAHTVALEELYSCLDEKSTPEENCEGLWQRVGKAWQCVEESEAYARVMAMPLTREISSLLEQAQELECPLPMDDNSNAPINL